MNKFKSIYTLFLFVLFVPKVYAFTYDIETVVGNTNVEIGTVSNIKLKFKDVTGLTSGFGACELNISFDDTITLNGNVSGLNGWSMIASNKYTFDTQDGFANNVELASIPVKINGAGSVKISNIMCSDGYTEENVMDKVISFSIKQKEEDKSQGTSDSQQANNNVPSTQDKEDDGGDSPVPSSDISDIVPTEGEIKFDRNVAEYNISIEDYENFDVEVVANDGYADYSKTIINVENGKQIIISVYLENGVGKTYTINVTEKEDVATENEEVIEEKGFNFVPIFIGIICVLVLINVFRIVRKIKK